MDFLKEILGDELFGQLAMKSVKLAKKKKYYVRVRGYVTYNGKNYYGAWSKVKTIRTKK